MLRKTMMLAALLALCLPGMGDAQGINYYPASGGTQNLQTRPFLYDEFISNGTTSGAVSALKWFFGGTATFAYVDSEENRPGIGRLSVTGSLSYFHLLQSVYQIRYDSVERMTWIVRSATVANEPDRRIGLTTGVNSATPANAVLFEKLAADTNWFAVTRVGGTPSRTDTGVAFATATFTKFDIVPVSGGVQFFINDALVRTESSVPAASTSMMPVLQGNHAGTNFVLDIDYFLLQLKATGR